METFTTDLPIQVPPAVSAQWGGVMEEAGILTMLLQKNFAKLSGMMMLRVLQPNIIFIPLHTIITKKGGTGLLLRIYVRRTAEIWV
jgi:hypothetical protein